MTDNPKSANLDLALHYLEMGRPEQTLSALERVEETQLEEPFYWYLRGQALFDQEQYQEANRATRKGLALAPEEISLLYLLCNIESNQKDLGAAETAILKALRQEPDNPQLLCRYAMLAAQGSQLDKADRLLAEARRRDPQYPAVARTEMALAHLRGADKEVVRLGQESLTVDPEDPYDHFMIGIGLAAQGRATGAERFLSGAARLDPANNDFAELALEARLATHWLMIPLWPIVRFGNVPVWMAAIVILLTLSQFAPKQLLTFFSLFYLVFVVYSWVVPPLLRRWMIRRRRRFK